MHHVIVGSGPAGVVAAEILRKNQKEAKIAFKEWELKPDKIEY